MTLTAMTTEQLRNLDATATTAGFSAETLTERAGLELARFLQQRLRPEESVLFLCGPGSNGGDGMVAARHLANMGFRTSALLSSNPLSPTVQRARKLLDVARVPAYPWEKHFSLTPYDVVVDCLLGYGQTAAPRDTIKDIVLGAKDKRAFACDIPTGINNDTGEVYEPHIKAEETLSLAAPKKAFLSEEARKACGVITVVGIGIPKQVYEQVGVHECLVEGSTRFP